MKTPTAFILGIIISALMALLVYPTVRDLGYRQGWLAGYNAAFEQMQLAPPAHLPQ